jgi:hypothetical protein
MTKDPSSAKRFTKRFDGTAAFSELLPEVQVEIGGLALEIVLAWNGQDAYENEEWTRPFHTGEPLLLDQLQSAAEDSLKDILNQGILPVPSRLGQVCEICGCSDEDACQQGCSWISPTLCSACEHAMGEFTKSTQETKPDPTSSFIPQDRNK